MHYVPLISTHILTFYSELHGIALSNLSTCSSSHFFSREQARNLISLYILFYTYFSCYFLCNCMIHAHTHTFPFPPTPLTTWFIFNQLTSMEYYTKRTKISILETTTKVYCMMTWQEEFFSFYIFIFNEWIIFWASSTYHILKHMHK